jgi:hypothetical protein
MCGNVWLDVRRHGLRLDDEETLLLLHFYEQHEPGNDDQAAADDFGDDEAWIINKSDKKTWNGEDKKRQKLQ